MKSHSWLVSIIVGSFLWAVVGCETEQPTTKKPGGEKSSTAAPANETKSEPAKDIKSEPAKDPVNDPVKEPVKEPAKPAPEAAKPAAEPAKTSAVKPVGMPAVPVPDDNPMTAEKIELGKMLYFDARLSRDGSVSCATCHDPKQGWAEQQKTSTGIDGQVGGRNSPSVLNAAYAKAQFWDGRAASLEEQALGPVQNPIEMGNTLPAMVATLAKVPEYKERFKKVFGSEITADGVAKAIAAFERTVVSGNSPYDRFKAGDVKALTDVQKHGMDTFKRGGCASCHAGPLFSSYEYYNAGAGKEKGKDDTGRLAVTKQKDDTGKFRVPSLRDVAATGPYFHDGSAATLDEAVALMAAGGVDNANLSAGFSVVREAKLTEQDRKDIVEFLKALSGQFPVIEAPKLP